MRTIIKVTLAVAINILFAYLMIYTVVDPNSTFVKNHDGTFIQPDKLDLVKVEDFLNKCSPFIKNY